MSEGKFEQGAMLYRRAIKLNPNHDFLSNLAKLIISRRVTLQPDDGNNPGLKSELLRMFRQTQSRNQIASSNPNASTTTRRMRRRPVDARRVEGRVVQSTTNAQDLSAISGGLGALEELASHAEFVIRSRGGEEETDNRGENRARPSNFFEESREGNEAPRSPKRHKPEPAAEEEAGERPDSPRHQ